MQICIVGKPVKSALEFDARLNGLPLYANPEIIVDSNSAAADDEIYLIEDPATWFEGKRVPEKNRTERRREAQENRRKSKMRCSKHGRYV